MLFAGPNVVTAEHSCGIQFENASLPRCIVARLWCLRHEGVMVAPALRVLELHSCVTIMHEVFNQCHGLQELSLSAGPTTGSFETNIDLRGFQFACLKHLRVLKLKSWCLLEDGAFSLLNTGQLQVFELNLQDIQGSTFTIEGLLRTSFSHIVFQVGGRKLSCRLQK